MEIQRGLWLHLIFSSIFLLATTYTCLGVQNITVICSEHERLALLNFKHNLVDSFQMLSSWVGNDCCLWERIHCNSVTGNVESIHLRGNPNPNPRSSHRTKNDHDYLVPDEYYLVGNQLNSSLVELRHLKYLDLSGNDFQGSRIPEFIGSLKELSYLNLSKAGFHGIIPHHLGNLSNLNVLDLSSNYELMADDMAWTFGLLSLEHLNLSFLALSGTRNLNMVPYMIPSLKEFTLSYCGLSNSDLGPFLNSSRIVSKIKYLDLGYNVFNGPLLGILQNMTSLTFLDISLFDQSSAWNFAKLLNMIPSLSELHLTGCGLDNTFLSPLHLNLSTLSNIQHLEFSDNSFKGIFPSVLTNMSSLKVLDLSGNMLQSWVPVMPNLLELDVSSNKFKKIEHLGIWRQCNLIQLRAFHNFDMKMIDSPKNISECSQYALQRLDLHESLNGTIPETLGRMKNLRGIDLSSSRLTGSIPKSLENLRFLEVVDLSYNQLTGPIPRFIGKLSKLDLSFNQMSGSIPDSFGKLSTLTDFYLEVNRLTGPIPASLGGLVSLREISVYSNLLNGTIPVSFGQLSKLRWLDMSHNSFEGVISEAHFANLPMLRHFDTSSNTNLTFSVSREWVAPFQLVTLLLRSCNIVDGFPQWLQNQRKLEKLVLSNATITGPLPTWLRKMPIIPFLDLSHNKLSGPLTNLPNGRNLNVFGVGVARALLLGYNHFNESIPRSICRRTDLEYLELPGNMLTGKIPKCLQNLQKLLTMRFSSNRLSGVIPGCIAIESLLRLQLNDNNFVGELPQEFENLEALYLLDLGDNELSGNMPEWIGEKLLSLMVLRLHKNNFTGRIPGSLCKTSDLQILDVAYNNFTGTIPRCLGELNAMVNGTPVLSYYDGLDSDEDLIQALKGVELEYTTTLDIVFNMDLSSNRLVGEIPFELTALSMLMGLNLSNNLLTGGIPNIIGNMTSLCSLDLSSNNLIGMIPLSMEELNFLSYLNLSHNNLSGQIPTGNQLQTLIDPSIYGGNKYLCGPPLPKECSNHEDPKETSKKKYEAPGKLRKLWFYLDIMSGFAIGFWGVIGVLLFKKHWRHKLFMFVEETMDKIYVVVVVRVSKMKMKRGREAHRFS